MNVKYRDEIVCSILNGYAECAFYRGATTEHNSLYIGVLERYGAGDGISFSIIWNSDGTYRLNMDQQSIMLVKLFPDLFDWLADQPYRGYPEVSKFLSEMDWKSHDTPQGEKKYLGGEIPKEFKPFLGSSFVYYQPVDFLCDTSWSENLSAPVKFYYDIDVSGQFFGVYLLESEEDYTLTKVRFS